LAAAFVTFENQGARLAILAVTAVTDLLDGIWARHLGGSRLGAILDPICDKVFMAAGFWVVLKSGLLHPLEIVGTLLRDIVSVAGYLLVTLLRRPTTLPARAGGKAVTVCQLLTLTAFVLRPDLVRPLAWATVAISLYAIADYGGAVWKTNRGQP
jgi:phosphatidylglycerophosphate synthase